MLAGLEGDVEELKAICLLKTIYILAVIQLCARPIKIILTFSEAEIEHIFFSSNESFLILSECSCILFPVTRLHSFI